MSGEKTKSQFLPKSPALSTNRALGAQRKCFKQEVCAIKEVKINRNMDVHFERKNTYIFEKDPFLYVFVFLK